MPDTARRRVLDVHCLIDEVQIFEDGVLIARHALLPGRGQSCIDPAHRKALQRSRIVIDDSAVVVRGPVTWSLAARSNSTTRSGASWR